jgi:hypothetical protein
VGCYLVLADAVLTTLTSVLSCVTYPCVQNSYGAGLTDWDNCSMYGKLALFIFAAWAGQEVSSLGPDPGGVQ